MRCESCAYWQPCLLHYYMGYCSKLDRFTFGENEACNEYFKGTLEDEFFWCIDCKTYLHRSEMSLHVGHRMYKNFFIDPLIYVETYTAD